MKKLDHYIKTLIINKRKYFFLSVTIIISFLLLFMYIAIDDSNIYNQYKELYALKDDISIVMGNRDSINTLENMENVIKKIKSIKYGYAYFEQQQVLNQYDDLSVQIQFVPNVVYEHYVFAGNYLKKVEFENDYVHIADDEVIVEKKLYDFLCKSNVEYIMLPISVSEREKILKRVRVVGYCVIDDESLWEHMYIFASNKLLKGFENNQCVNYNALIFSDNINELQSLVTMYNLDIYSIADYKRLAKTEMLNNTKNRLVIVVIIYFLLSINLYSSFTNCLSDRKYEIGVKRAIGIKTKEIVGQFFFEGIVITFINIILSIWIGLFCLILYKRFYAPVGWIIYMSKYSVCQFLIVSVFLCLFFSIMFAWMTTKVDILENLRKE